MKRETILNLTDELGDFLYNELEYLDLQDSLIDSNKKHQDNNTNKTYWNPEHYCILEGYKLHQEKIKQPQTTQTPVQNTYSSKLRRV